MIIPVNYARNLVNIDDERLNPTLMVKPKSGIAFEELESELKNAMRSIRKLKPKETDNFALNKITLISQGLDQFFGVLNIAGWLIGGLSILVGGFGIANIMFVSVKERTNQIGIQKSLGAKRYFILTQFLFESMVLTFIGGILGMIIVYLL
ncbi:MAG: FtsX-like permease family protein, partial [Bacteroidetes bacterium]|nr:FtsX-like permease family protein [Bacteroidota bacterium]